MPEIAAVLLGVFLCVVGLTHFIFPGYFLRLVPDWAPFRRYLVPASGVAEIVVGALVLWPATRAVGAWAAAALITIYLTSHFDALARSGGVSWKDPLFGPPGAAMRVVVNVLYVAWAIFVATTA